MKGRSLRGKTSTFHRMLTTAVMTHSVILHARSFPCFAKDRTEAEKGLKCAKETNITSLFYVVLVKIINISSISTTPGMPSFPQEQ
ncbi:hypothetical protein L1987_51501 [Smallanthus sonchifolius]|uniref:Uncharacterized protein n=1 Tax=Smallanthus sonchifolius TaxID=185202 RepID=A0ACB9EPV6_9ASTR|nr:hypothetical protein L1987_51501 [Smallanthus sonchifolius]